MGKLEGRVAIVTGAGRGLGKQVAIRFAEEGARISICARSLDRLEDTRKKCEQAGAEVFCFVCDVTKISDMEAYVAATAEHFGGIDILYNNAMATTCGRKPFEEQTQEDFDNFYQSGLMGSFHMMRLCFPWLKKKRAWQGHLHRFGRGRRGAGWSRSLWRNEGSHSRHGQNRRPGMGQIQHQRQHD